MDQQIKKKPRKRYSKKIASLFHTCCTWYCPNCDAVADTDGTDGSEDKGWITCDECGMSFKWQME